MESIAKILCLFLFVGLGITGITLMMVDTKRRLLQKVTQDNFKFIVQCDNCNSRYLVEPKDFFRFSMIKQSNTFSGALGAGNNTYSMYKKKFNCPYCNSRCYGNVLNINEYNSRYRMGYIISIIVWLVILLVGMSIITSILRLLIK